ncbi:MAG: hypothetical protein ACF8MJ_02025 [Phycisphaerales bacterium JB050]
MGLLDRFKGKKQHTDAKEAPAQVDLPEESSKATAEETGETPVETPTPPEPPQQDMTEQWLQGQMPGVPGQSGSGHGFTGVAGSIKPLTHSMPVETGDPAQAVPPPVNPEPEAQPPKQVEPVSEDEIDRRLVQAMKGHSTKDFEALWDAILSKPEIHLLQRGKGEKTEAHAVESPLGPMLLLFTAPYRIQALAAMKQYRNSPFVWKAVTMPTEDALGWIFQQHAKGVQAVEFNRSAQPGIASVLQALPARYERLYGRRPKGADLVDPDFEVLANRAKIAGNADAHAQLLATFFSLQRWYALRDPKRPNQPGFTPIEDKPTLMLFTSETEAKTAAVQSGRERELPKVIMPLTPAKIAPWMAKLPEMGAEQAIVNLGSTAFLLPLAGIEQRFASNSAG